VVVKKSILIVDDNISLREGLRTLLSSQQEFEIVGEAGDGLEAIAFVDQCLPDLVLMDITMPLMNCIEATRKIKAKRPSAIILIFTCQNAPEYVSASFKAGADGYILKDTPRSVLIQSIKELISGEQRFKVKG
jgi:two-component system, NarL family, response regulator YdfI